MSQEARTKMELAAWNAGRKKASITVAIQKLKQTGFESNPDVKKVIDFLSIERKKLDHKEIF